MAEDANMGIAYTATILYYNIIRKKLVLIFM